MRVQPAQTLFAKAGGGGAGPILGITAGCIKSGNHPRPILTFEVFELGILGEKSKHHVTAFEGLRRDSLPTTQPIAQDKAQSCDDNRCRSILMET